RFFHSSGDRQLNSDARGTSSARSRKFHSAAHTSSLLAGRASGGASCVERLRQNLRQPERENCRVPAGATFRPHRGCSDASSSNAGIVASTEGKGIAYHRSAAFGKREGARDLPIRL